MATITATTAVLQPSGLTALSPIKPITSPSRTLSPSQTPTTQLQGFSSTGYTWLIVTSVRRVVYPKTAVALINGAYVVPPTSGSMNFQWG
jgi:hypothetical protein